MIQMLQNLPPDIQAFLTLIALTPGVLFSQLENWQWFAGLTTPVKWALQIVASGIAGAILVAISLGAIPASTVTTLNSGYLTIVAIITSILANFVTHISVNKVLKPAGKALQGYAASKGVGIGPKG